MNEFWKDMPINEYKQLAVPDIDFLKLKSYRLNRIREQLVNHDYAMAVLINPVSMRYAIDLNEYELFQSRIPTYYLFVSAEGPVVLHGASRQVENLVDELRPSSFLNVFDGGLDLSDHAENFANEIKQYLYDINAQNNRIACERLNPSAHHALLKQGLESFDAESLMEQARLIKSAEELQCMRYAVSVAEYAMQEMAAALREGISENQLFSILHQINISHGGDWIDGRMLNSGERSNPWFQQASDKLIKAGEMVAFDTDMIGPLGYCADISRTFFCEPGSPSQAQKNVYRRAYEEIQHNIDLIKPGLSFKQLCQQALVQDDEFIPNQYVCLAHGVGMSDEYPKIYYPKDWGRYGYDGVIQANTVLSVESFTGSVHGGPGVKLEQMVLVNEHGCELLSTFPFEQKLL